MNLHRRFNKYKYGLIFLLLAAFHIFLRFYELAKRTELGWDQMDTAWAAFNLLEGNKLLIEGVPIKGNTSMTMGPLYYYLAVPFYKLTSLDPIAASIFAGVVSIVSMFIFYLISKKIMGKKVASIALAIYVFSPIMVQSERVQAAYILIPIISYITFYFLYRLVVSKNSKYLIWLAGIIGFGFHVHFVSFFYPFLVLLMLPFLPDVRKDLSKYIISLIIFLLFLSPMLYSVFFNSSGGGQFLTYFGTYFHGFHLRRVLQIAHDGFISFEMILQYKFFPPLVYLVLPLFAGIYYFTKPSKNSLLLSYLAILWVVIPWLFLSTYSGELTHYYFSASRYVAILIIAYLINFLLNRGNIIVKYVVVSFWVIYIINSVQIFIGEHEGNYMLIKEKTGFYVDSGKVLEFKDRDADYYFYHIKQLKAKK